MKKYLLLLLLLTLFSPAFVSAKIGVGVATGKVVVNEKLKPGTIYTLPPLTVLNTGDVPADYEVEVTHFEKQTQHKPHNEWFSFSPQKFHLEPKKVQVVTIKLNVPLSSTPGDYFGFLEAHPIQKDKVGNSTIGIAAAAKLYFTVVPANIFQAIYYRMHSLWDIYAPWPQRIIMTIIFLLIIHYMRKVFNIQISLKKPFHFPQKGAASSRSQIKKAAQKRRLQKKLEKKMNENN